MGRGGRGGERDLCLMPVNELVIIKLIKNQTKKNQTTMVAANKTSVVLDRRFELF